MIDKNYKKFKELPEYLQLGLRWMNWMHHDWLKTGDTSTWMEYSYLRYWLVDQSALYGVFKNIAPTAKDKHVLSVWFEFDRHFDKESCMAMKHKNYEVKVRRNKYTMIELT